jgi:hypothetical protein
MRIAVQVIEFVFIVAPDAIKVLSVRLVGGLSLSI